MAGSFLCYTTVQPRGLGLIDLKRKISTLHVMWVRRLVEYSVLPSLYYFQHHLRVAFAGRTVHQISMLPAPSRSALDLLPAFYRSVMTSWFCLRRQMVDGEIVVSGSEIAFCSLRSLSPRFVYQQFSRLDNNEHHCIEKYWRNDC